jgi:methyl-accepting chemotaxis protein/methyl-accepting chemotaxis protein-1 (serine sensor receptor)
MLLSTLELRQPAARHLMATTESASKREPMTISKKLFLSSGFSMLLIAILGIVGLVGISRIQNMIELCSVDAHKVYLDGQIKAGALQMLGDEREMVRRASLHDQASVEKYSADLRETASKTRAYVDENLPLARTAGGKRVLGEMQSDIGVIVQNNDELYRLCKSENLSAAADVLANKVDPLVQKIVGGADTIVGLANGLVVTSGISAESIVLQTRWMFAILFVLSIAVGSGVIFIVRQINRTLTRSLFELSGGAEQIASAASQVATSSQSLAQGSSEQAASLEETASSSEEINSMAKKNTDNAHSMATLVGESQDLFTTANRQLEEMVVSMDEINESSSRISKVNKTIDDIAFQINILALNAAVEAARAGEAGMGFAVVADEVRNLAHRSAQAAKDTAAMIEDSIAKSNSGKVKVDQIATAIRTITEVSGKIKILVDEVTLASDEQSRGLDQIAKGISQMEQVTQTTAASAEESAAAAEELDAQSESLKHVVSQLNAIVHSESDRNGHENSGGRKLRRGLEYEMSHEAPQFTSRIGAPAYSKSL